ncbi:MAG: DUF1007 family protein [Spirochaetaceae bacterium]|nr:DUF1007 family protein [Spirochaetaceae bacterium]
MQHIRLIFLISIITIIQPALLSAHPHMWIRGQVIPELGRRGLESVRIIWNIDEFTSASLILDYDINGDGKLNPSEVENLRLEAFEHLFESEYYLLVEIRNLIATPGRARNFVASIYEGRIIYDFQVPFEVPIRWDDIPDVSIFLFDQSYFIDFRPEEIADYTAVYRNTEVFFQKVNKRSMTLGYGMIVLTGLTAVFVREG